MSELDRYKKAVSIIVRRAGKFGVSLDEEDVQKLNVLWIAIFWIDRHFDENNEKNWADKVLPGIETGKIDEGLGSHPETRVAVQNLIEVLHSLSERQQEDFKVALRKGLEHGERLHTTKNIQEFIESRRQEAIHVGDMSPIFFADKIDRQDEKTRNLIWKSFRDCMVIFNFADSIKDAIQDRKNNEIQINPHLLRLHLLFGNYPGKPPVPRFLKWFAKRKLKSALHRVL